MRAYLMSAFALFSVMDGYDTTNFFSVLACLDTTLAIFIFLARIRQHAQERRLHLRAANTPFFPVAMCFSHGWVLHWSGNVGVIWAPASLGLSIGVSSTGNNPSG